MARLRFRNRNPDPESRDLITSPNLASMEAFVSDLRGDPQRSTRIISFCARHFPNTLSLKLTHLFMSSPHLRANSFDVFARALRSAGSKFNITPMILPEIKSPILECLIQESSNNQPSKALSQTVGGVASSVYSKSKIIRGEWPELLHFVTSCITASDDNKALQEWGLLVFRYLPERALQGLNYPQFGLITTTILRQLFSSDTVIRASTISASVSLVKSCTRYRDLDRLLPRFISAAEDLIASGQHDLAAKALRTLVQIAMKKPGFFTEQLGVLFESVVRIAERNDIEEEMRAEAIQVLREVEDGIGDEMTKMMEKLSDENVERFVKLMVNFLEYVEDDPFWYRVDHDVVETQEEKRSILLGTYFLDRLSFVQKGTVLPIVVRLARERVREQEWRKRHAGVQAIEVVTEGCAEVFSDYLEEVLMLTLGLFRDLHVRVRAAAVRAIRVLSFDLDDTTVHENYHDKIVPALAVLAGDSVCPSLQMQASVAIVFFCKNCKPDYLAPYLVGLTRIFLTVCRSQYKRVQEWGFSAVASVAASSQANFNLVYDSTMASLKDILSKTNTFTKLARARCLECISDIAGAVGRERFLSDSTLVMDALMSLLGSLQRPDHEIKIIIFRALMNLLSCLGEELSPYVPALVPVLIHSSQLYNSGAADTSVNQSYRFDGLEEKALACKVLRFMARELPNAIFPSIMEVANALVPLLQFDEHLETKEIAISAFPELLQSAMSVAERGNSQTNTSSFVQKLVLLVIPALSEALEKETQRAMCIKFLSTIDKCILVGHQPSIVTRLFRASLGYLLELAHLVKVLCKGANALIQLVSGSVFSKAQGSSITKVIKRVLATISQRDKQEMDKEDEVVYETDPEDYVKEQEEKILRETTNCLCSLIKIFKSGFLPCFDELVTYIPMMWDDRRSSKEKVMGFSIFRNLVQQCGADAQKYYDMYLPRLLKACTDDDPSVRQEAALGIGACAESGDAIFRAQIGAALESLDFVIGHPEALSPENGKTYDAAVSALGKICRFHRDNINAPEIIPTWLTYLPLMRDLDEAKIVHDQLCLMVETRDYDLFGPDNRNLPIIIAVLEEVLHHQENLATANTARRMTTLLPRLKAEANL